MHQATDAAHAVHSVLAQRLQQLGEASFTEISAAAEAGRIQHQVQQLPVAGPDAGAGAGENLLLSPPELASSTDIHSPSSSDRAVSLSERASPTKSPSPSHTERAPQGSPEQSDTAQLLQARPSTLDQISVQLNGGASSWSASPRAPGSSQGSGQSQAPDTPSRDSSHSSDALSDESAEADLESRHRAPEPSSSDTHTAADSPQSIDWGTLSAANECLSPTSEASLLPDQQEPVANLAQVRLFLPQHMTNKQACCGLHIAA